MDHELIPHVQWRGLLGVVVCGPLGAAANLFDPATETAAAQGCVARGQSELDVIVDKLNDGLQQAHGTGHLAVAFGVPILQRKIAAKVAAARGRPLPVVPDPPEATPEAERDTTRSPIATGCSACRTRGGGSWKKSPR